jgi:hypothetical protein
MALNSLAAITGLFAQFSLDGPKPVVFRDALGAMFFRL